MRRALVIARKEWAELWASPGLLASMAALPGVMVGVPILMVVAFRGSASDPGVGAFSRLYAGFAQGDNAAQILVAATVKSWLALFLIMPLFIPVLIASTSVAGEKERRTLEPLLATPITAFELVLGKSLSAVLPAVLITWIAFAVFCVGIDWVAWPVFGRLVLPDGPWLFAVAILSPILSFFGNGLAVLVSARVGESRLAQQLSALVVIPFVGLVVAQMVGALWLGPGFYLGLAAGALLADYAMLRLAVRVFDGERLLTRWG